MTNLEKKLEQYFRKEVDNARTSLQNVEYGIKQEKWKNGEYHYIPSYPSDVLKMIKVLPNLFNDKINFLDLGGGPGIIPHILKRYNIVDEAYNYDNVKEYIDVAKSNYPEVTSKVVDLFKSTAQDFENINCVYMYEPAEKRKMKKLWVEKLEEVLPNNCIILYKRAGSIHEFLCKSDYFVNVYNEDKECGDFYAFKFIKRTEFDADKKYRELREDMNKNYVKKEDIHFIIQNVVTKFRGNMSTKKSKELKEIVAKELNYYKF